MEVTLTSVSEIVVLLPRQVTHPHPKKSGLLFVCCLFSSLVGGTEEVDRTDAKVRLSSIVSTTEVSFSISGFKSGLIHGYTHLCLILPIFLSMFT